MSYAPQGVKGVDDDDDDDDDDEVNQYTDTERAKCAARVSCLYRRTESAGCSP